MNKFDIYELHCNDRAVNTFDIISRAVTIALCTQKQVLSLGRYGSSSLLPFIAARVKLILFCGRIVVCILGSLRSTTLYLWHFLHESLQSTFEASLKFIRASHSRP